MKLRNLRYFLKEAFKSLVKNRLMSVASIMTVASCIFILTIAYCMARNIDHLLLQLENTMGLSVFLSEELSADDVNDLYNAVLAMDEVRGVKYISEDEALRRFAENLGEDSEIIEALHEDNPLRRSFEIELYSNRQQAAVIAGLQKFEGVENVRHTVEMIDLFVSINNAVGVISLVFILTLGVISIVIIMNTIKLTVNSRRFEIGIMKYVGATNWFIRWPFVIEGILIGVIGSVIPVGVCGYGYDKATEWVYSFPLLETIGDFLSVTTLFSFLSPAAITLGMLMGSLGSIISMRKYLQV